MVNKNKVEKGRDSEKWKPTAWKILMLRNAITTMMEVSNTKIIGYDVFLFNGAQPPYT
jgi:hypothetical protein